MPLYDPIEAFTGVAAVGPVPPLGDFLAAVIPSNVVKAAAESAFLSLIIFALIFAFAMTRIATELRTLLTNFFVAVRETMLVVIEWVLWVGPVGVFALALVVGANDVVNPAAETTPGAPIYGMPILHANQARQVVFMKRSMRPGFAGIENELLFEPTTTLFFGDAKESLGKLLNAVKAL